MTAASIIVGAVLDLIAMAVALLVAACYLAFLLRAAILRVEQLEKEVEHHDNEAGHWRARYYIAASDRDEVSRDRDYLLRRNSQLTAALRRTTELLEGTDQPAWMQMLPPITVEFLTCTGDLPAADVDAFVADVERHANSEQDQ